MLDFIAVAAKHLTKDQILAELKLAIKNYESNPSSQNESQVVFHCALFMIKQPLEKDGLLKTLTDLEEHRNVQDTIKNSVKN